MSLREAILAAPRAVVEPVYDGTVPVDEDGRPVAQRYAVVYSAVPVRESEDLPRSGDRHVARWQVTSVGTTAQQAEWVALRVRDAYLDRLLVAEGWQVGVVEHTSSVPIRRDDDVPGESLFYAIDTYRTTATH